MMRKTERILRIVTLVAIVFASLGLGLSGFTNYYENLNAAHQRSAAAECIEFNSPHALVIEGEIYCYVMVQGTEMIAPVKVLRYPQEQ